MTSPASEPPRSAPPRFEPLEFQRRSPEDSRRCARELRVELGRRRSVRSFAPDPLPLDVLDECIATAGSAPSGANLQPWTFVVVTDPSVKAAIRAAAEEEERINYAGRMGAEWLADLEPFGTGPQKPFLEIAPALIVVLRHAYRPGEEGKKKLYYTQESVGIAVGFLLAALHHAGFATLTHTPSPMGFLERILARPAHERAYLLIPVGYPAADCTVPALTRRGLDEIRVRV
jgi:iodotyrosine deiodinase